MRGPALAFSLLASLAATQNVAPGASSGGGALLAPAASIAPFTDDQLVLGAKTAPITVIEYLSTTCSHCAAFERDTWPRVDQTFVRTGQVRYIIREMPTAPVALSAAGFLLSRCAGRDRYWEVVQAILRAQSDVLSAPTLSDAIVLDAKIAGLDPDATEACLSDPVAVDAINERRQEGLAAGIDSTPFFIIDGHALKPGLNLAGKTYEGGELTFGQFAAAVHRYGRAKPSSEPPRL